MGSFTGQLFRCYDCTVFEAKLDTDLITLSSFKPLYDALMEYSGRTVSDGSAGTYLSNRRRFLKFCSTQLGISAGQALPIHPGLDVSALHVQLFIVWARDFYALSTIKNTLSAIADWQRSRGVPESKFVSRNKTITSIITNIARERAADFNRPLVNNAKAPITVHLLRLMFSELLEPTGSNVTIVSLRAQQDMAIFALGFFGFMRRSELGNLRIRDIQFFYNGNEPSHLTVFIRKSKNDALGKGALIYIYWFPKAGINVFKYIQVHLVNRVTQGGRIDDPLFSSFSGHDSFSNNGISKSFVTDRLRAILTVLHSNYPFLNLDTSLFASHSLRRGGVVAAFEAGISIELLKAHGRWRSDAILVYLSVSEQTRLIVTFLMKENLRTETRRFD